MLRKDWDDMADNGTRGDWYFHNDESYITIRWGDDHMDVVTIPISTGEKQEHKWLWNGNKETPTIIPSIRILGNHDAPDLWHGFLTEGKVIDV